MSTKKDDCTADYDNPNCTCSDCRQWRKEFMALGRQVKREYEKAKRLSTERECLRETDKWSWSECRCERCIEFACAGADMERKARMEVH